MKIQIIDNHRASLPNSLPGGAFDRGKLFGDGFFTTGIIENYQLLHSERHRKRLLDAGKRLLFTTFSAQMLFEYIANLASSAEKAVVRISVNRTQPERGYAMSKHQNCLVTIELSPWAPLPADFCQAFFADTPISINPLLAGTKHLNRLDNVLAASEIDSFNQEALMSAGDNVICGSRSNLFICKDNCWLTPKLNFAGIEGITKQRLLDCMRSNAIAVAEKEISKADVVRCEAAFLTNSLLGIWPISRVENAKLATDLVCRLQSKLNFSR